jgi:hypothetical protein
MEVGINRSYVYLPLQRTSSLEQVVSSVFVGGRRPGIPLIPNQGIPVKVSTSWQRTLVPPSGRFTRPVAELRVQPCQILRMTFCYGTPEHQERTRLLGRCQPAVGKITFFHVPEQTLYFLVPSVTPFPYRRRDRPERTCSSKRYGGFPPLAINSMNKQGMHQQINMAC